MLCSRAASAADLCIRERAATLLWSLLYPVELLISLSTGIVPADSDVHPRCYCCSGLAKLLKFPNGENELISLIVPAQNLHWAC